MINKNGFFKKMLFTAGVLLISAHSFASGNTSIGVLAGIGSYNNNVGTQFSFGGTVHHKFMPVFGAGVTVTSASLTGNSSVMHYDADLFYHFEDTLQGLWVGPRLGLGSLSAGTSTSAFEFGGAAGYDYLISEPFSIGLDLSYITATYNSTTVGVFQAFGSIKYHL